MEVTKGKRLVDLAYEVDVLHKNVGTITEDHASICWQENGTLCHFDASDGYPGFYWYPSHASFGDSRESFTSLTNLIQYWKASTSDEYDMWLLEAPVWKVYEDTSKENEVAAFNALLGDITIDLPYQDTTTQASFRPAFREEGASNE